MISIYGVTAKPSDMTKVFPLTKKNLFFWRVKYIMEIKYDF